MAEKLTTEKKAIEYLEKIANRKLTDAEIFECLQSFFYLGRAIYKYKLQKQQIKEVKSVQTT